MTSPVRIALEPKPPPAGRPLVLRIGLWFKPLSRWLVRRVLELPPGRLRSRLVGWTVRDLISGAYARRDAEAIRTFSSTDSTYVPPGELEALLTDRDFVALSGVEAGIRALEVWRDAWGDYEVVAREVFDFGDGRFLILWHLSISGAGSGVVLKNQEWAELFQWERGLVSSMQQWMDWDQGLAAVGLSRAALRAG